MNAAKLDETARGVAFSSLEGRRELAQNLIREVAEEGVFPASIAGLFSSLGRGDIAPMTVPAFNLRGLTYDLARAIWQVALQKNAGPVIFELAPSEMSSGDQIPEEYAAMVMAAACREGYQGPVFLQGDHFHIDSPAAFAEMEGLCKRAVSAGFYQIDIDTADLIDPAGDSPAVVQAPNANLSARMTRFIRSIQPEGVHITIGAEVGEIGSKNTTLADLSGFMDAYQARLGDEIHGLDKISIQTGTRHGGIVLKDGSLDTMPLDLKLARELSRAAFQNYGISGLVQHGASTLALSQLAQLPDAGIIEVHLATQIQNIIFDHPAFPPDLLRMMKASLAPSNREAEGGASHSIAAENEIQRFYHARWSAWGTFKREIWDMPEQNKKQIQETLQEWVSQLFTALRIDGKLPVVLGMYHPKG